MRTTGLMHRRDLEQFARRGGGRRFYNDPRWSDALPEELRNEPFVKDSPDLATAIKRGRDAHSMVGSSLRPPGKNATDEEKAAFRKALAERVPDLVELPQDEGRALDVLRDRGLVPKAGEDYTLEGVIAAEGVSELPAEMLAELRKEAVEGRYTKSQFRVRAQKVLNALGQGQRVARDGDAALRQEWGADYERRLSEATALAEQTGAPQSLRDDIRGKRITKDVANWLIGLAKRLGVNAREAATQEPGTGGGMTPQQAIEKLDEIDHHPVILGNKKGDPTYKALLAEKKRLLPFAFPELAKGEL